MDILDKEIVHVSGRKEWEGVKFNRVTQNGTPSQTNELFIAGIFHRIFSNHY